MKKNLDCIAFHEAGHAVAHVLAGIPFKFVSIKEDMEKDEFGYRSLGQVANENPMTPEEWEKHSIMDPNEFNTFFKDDFTKLAGLVAEGVYRRRFNYNKPHRWIFCGGVSINREKKEACKSNIYRLYHFVTICI
jgi:hypothetical protein